jgi:mono/diheme cytochrome c family protein
MNKLVKILLVLLGVLVLLGGAGYGWAWVRTSQLRSRTIETHRVDFPVPFPLSDEERVGLDSTADAAAVALARAIERGRHLVSSRYVCTECHGASLGGGVMIDDPMIGQALGPNITLGSGSRTATYGPADWDRAVRHGVSIEGHPTVMPAVDFQLMSDQELSDVVAYVRSMPPVDNEVPPVRFGPLGTVLVATGAIPFSADVMPSHSDPHAVFPPAAEVSLDFGRHLAGVCAGCHGADFAGGPIPGGDPSWPPAMNLTPHADALGGWSYEDFAAALREGTRPNGATLVAPMSNVIPFTRNMTEVELQALWTYLESVPAVAPAS